MNGRFALGPFDFLDRSIDGKRHVSITSTKKDPKTGTEMDYGVGIEIYQNCPVIPLNYTAGSFENFTPESIKTGALLVDEPLLSSFSDDRNIYYLLIVLLNQLGEGNWSNVVVISKEIMDKCIAPVRGTLEGWGIEQLDENHHAPVPMNMN